MHALAPLPVIVPLLGAAMLAAGNAVLPRWLVDAFALACALATTAICALLLAHVREGLLVYWFSGFHPRAGVAIGISFTIDPLGAGMATLCSVLVSAALLYSVRYFDEIGSLYAALMLVFLAAMVGFCLTGDVFNLFVFFELMSVVAYALTAYKIEEAGPLQGAINFAITNSIGSFMILSGIALVYARTGALNLAQIGQALAAHRADGLVVVALLLIAAGLLVKAAIVPLHFWLADAHAVAPVPVCVLFSGVMVELGLLGFARVYWSAFSGPLAPHVAGLRPTLVAFGVLTVLVGSVMCLAQRHLKRLLAFSTITHSGMFLIGVGLLAPAGLAGAGDYVLAHAFIKAALFMAAGILLHRFATVDEHELRGRGRQARLRIAAAVFALGGLALAALPASGPFFGKSGLEDALRHTGYAWAIAFVLIGSAAPGAAVLRAGGRIFVGLGPRVPRHHELLTAVREQPETLQPHDRTPWVMSLPPALLLVVGLLIGLLPGLHDAVGEAAVRVADRAPTAAHVLAAAPVVALARPHVHTGALDWALGAISAAAALAGAAWALRSRPAWSRWTGLAETTTTLVIALRRLHSGSVCDYVAWLVLGVAALGGAFTLAVG